MSCLSRIGCLTVLAVAGAGAWWLYGGSLPHIDLNPVTPTARPARATSDRKPVAWAPVNSGVGGRSAPGSVRAVSPSRSAARIGSQLASPSGPAYVTLSASEVADLLSATLADVLPDSAMGGEIALEGDRMRVRSVLPLRELGGDALPPFVAALLTSRDTVEFAGSMDVVAPGVGQFHVKELHVRNIAIPPRLIRGVVRSIKSGQPKVAGVSDDALPLVLPPAVADTRISRGRLTLYKTVPKP